MRVTVIPIVVGALGTVSKHLERSLDELEIRRRTENMQKTALFRSAKTLLWRLAIIQTPEKKTPIKTSVKKLTEIEKRKC